METAVLIVAAAIMAVFGVMGYLRGTRYGIITAVLFCGGLVIGARSGDQVVKLVNGLVIGIRLMLSGGLQAMGSGNAEALRQAIAKAGGVKPLIPADQPGAALVLVLFVVLGLSLLLGAFKALKGAASLLGLIFGLINGYIIVAAFLLALAPELAVLPLPFDLGGAATAAVSITAAPAPAPAGLEVTSRIAGFVQGIAGSPGVAIVVAVSIAVFVFYTTRFGNRGGKKG
jgi:hypothetical protein